MTVAEARTVDGRFTLRKIGERYGLKERTVRTRDASFRWAVASRRRV